MDSNSKLGPLIVPDDPHQQSANGKLLEDVIKEMIQKLLMVLHYALEPSRDKEQLSMVKRKV